MRNSWADGKESCKLTSAQAVPSGKFIDFQWLAEDRPDLFYCVAPFNRTTTVRGLKRLCLNGAGDRLGRVAAQHGAGFAARLMPRVRERLPLRWEQPVNYVAL
jgi:hypothetical protein